MLFIAVIIIGLTLSGNVKFYMNDCVGYLYLDNYHNYTGILLQEPTLEVNDFEQGTFEYQYASRSEFGSLLDGNLNYYGRGTKNILVHYFYNVNTTGGIYADIEDHHTIGSKICTDVEQNKGTLPSVIGVYFWYIANSSFDACKSATPAIDSCTYFT
mmetsp:Transcript_42049/g.51747  ORF Transcript_42049/g.51747 Transcript_42049/m.51747 type:complete len:157 (+) Transcript_42049:47-517(+)